MLNKNQIKQIQLLQLKKCRDEKKLFIAEGVKSVNEIINFKPTILQYIYATPVFLEQNKTILTELNINYSEVTEVELKKISLQSNPNSVLSICSYFNYTESNFDFDNNFSLYLDDIRDPGNLGTIIRLADWYGITNFFCSPKSCDFFNPKVIQATMGAFLRVNVSYIELKELLSKNTIKNIYGGILNGENIYKQKLKNGLIIIGNESNGININNLNFINHPITIPSYESNKTESLNVALAGAIIVSEFYRQLKLN